MQRWSQRSKTVFVIVVAAVVMAIATAAALIPEDEPSAVESARYERVRAECTAAADAVGLVGRQRIDTINKCMVNR